MIKKIVRNKPTDEIPDIEPIWAIREKLDHYRSLIPFLPKMGEDQISELQSDVRTFFNFIPVHSLLNPPEYLFRISSNDGILGKEVGFLTKVSQLQYLMSTRNHRFLCID